MDSFRAALVQHERSDSAALGCDEARGDDDIGLEPLLADVGQNERRMQVRAYNYWTSLLGSRNFPQIDDLASAETAGFAQNAMMLDFSVGTENPAVTMLGDKLAEECGAAKTIERLSDIPGRSVLSRVADHYPEILTNQAPIGFEAEFVNLHGKTVAYRGILLPFSNDGDKIEHVMGVINWKELADRAMTEGLIRELDIAARMTPSPVGPQLGEWADGPASAEPADPLAETDLAERHLVGWLTSARNLAQAANGLEDGGTLAAKLRELPTLGWQDISASGSEFAVILVHRTSDGSLRLLGEVEAAP